MAKRKQNIFQKLSELDAQQQRKIERRVKTIATRKSKSKTQFKLKKIFVNFSITVIAAIIILAVIASVSSHGNSDPWQALGVAIILLYGGVIVVGIAVLVAVIYLLYFLVRRIEKGQK